MSQAAHFALCGLLACLVGPVAAAPDEAPAPALERVELAGARGSVMPYRRWVSAVKPVHDISGGHLRQGVRVFSQDRQRALRLSVTDDSQSQTIAPLVGELFVVPHDLPVQGADADLGVNRADGSWSVGNFALVPQGVQAEADLGAVRQALQAYRALYAQHFPLRWRLLSRAQAHFDVCSPEPGAVLTVAAPDGTALAQLPLTQQPKEHQQTTGLRLYCASVVPQAAWADAARLQLPAGAVALLGFRLL